MMYAMQAGKRGRALVACTYAMLGLVGHAARLHAAAAVSTQPPSQALNGASLGACTA